jgi:hypothetical protein
VGGAPALVCVAFSAWLSRFRERERERKKERERERKSGKETRSDNVMD